MTYSEFREYCKAHPVELECIWRFGKEILDQGDLPVPMRGRRRITRVTSFGFQLAYGEEATEADKAGFFSELRVNGAKAFQLNGDILTIYNNAPRPATEKEQAILDQWKKHSSKPEFAARETVDALTDGMSTYYEQKDFFAQFKGGSSLMKNRTRRIDPETGRELIKSKTNPGVPILRYKVYGLPADQATQN